MSQASLKLLVSSLANPKESDPFSKETPDEAFGSCWPGLLLEGLTQWHLSSARALQPSTSKQKNPFLVVLLNNSYQTQEKK